MTQVPLRRLVGSLDNGAWGEEPGALGVDASCVRAADFDYERLQVNPERVPQRSFEVRQVRRLALRRGDIVLEKSGGGDQTAVGRAVLWDRDETAVPTNFAARLRPAPHVESRYLTYLLASLYATGATERCIKQTTGIQNLDTDAWLNSPAPQLPVAEQRRIADFLDDQAARMNAAAPELRRLVSLAEAARKERLRDLVEQAGEEASPMSTLARIVDTEHRTAPPGEGGYWSAGTGAIRGGRLIRDRLLEISEETYKEWTRRSVPRPGDVLLTREAPIGESALLLSNDDRVAIGQRVVMLRSFPNRIRPEFLALYLLSPIFGDRITYLTQGSLHPHLNMADIARLRVPTPGLMEQGRLAAEFAAVSELYANLVRSAEQLVDRIEERKRALITACVTGKFDVSAAGNRAGDAALQGVAR